MLVSAIALVAEQTLVVPVSGNCNMCKKKIEKAANSVPGVTSAVWNRKEKKLTVTFDTEKTTKDSIVQAVLNVGYDADGKQAPNDAYSKLPDCCRYRDTEH